MRDVGNLAGPGFRVLLGHLHLLCAMDDIIESAERGSDDEDAVQGTVDELVGKNTVCYYSLHMVMKVCDILCLSVR